MQNKQLKIKINIAERVYPMRIQPEKEEALRRASTKINAMIKELESHYEVRDKQDVLAMCALQFVANEEQKDLSDKQSISMAIDDLHSINQTLDQVL